MSKKFYIDTFVNFLKESFVYTLNCKTGSPAKYTTFSGFLTHIVILKRTGPSAEAGDCTEPS